MGMGRRATLAWNTVVACLCLYNIKVKHDAQNYDLWFGISAAVGIWCAIDLFKALSGPRSS